MPTVVITAKRIQVLLISEFLVEYTFTTFASGVWRLIFSSAKTTMVEKAIRTKEITAAALRS